MDDLTETMQKLHKMALDVCTLYLTVQTVCDYLTSHPEDLQRVARIIKEGEDNA